MTDILVPSSRVGTLISQWQLRQDLQDAGPHACNAQRTTPGIRSRLFHDAARSPPIRLAMDTSGATAGLNKSGSLWFHLGTRWLPANKDGSWPEEVLAHHAAEMALASRRCCVVCLTAESTRRVVHEPEQTYESWNKQHACEHYSCMACMRTWLGVQIADGVSRIRCPAADCPYVLYDEDVKRHALPDDFTSYLELRNRHYKGRLVALALDTDDGFREWMAGNTRICPECSVILSRSSGCNRVVCTCGIVLCYGCGELASSCACTGPAL